jgi:hypothetical protein
MTRPADPTRRPGPPTRPVDPSAQPVDPASRHTDPAEPAAEPRGSVPGLRQSPDFAVAVPSSIEEKNCLMASSSVRIATPELFVW